MDIRPERLLPRTLTTQILTGLGMASLAVLAAQPNPDTAPTQVHALAVGDAHLLQLEPPPESVFDTGCGQIVLPGMLQLETCPETLPDDPRDDILKQLPPLPEVTIPEPVQEVLPAPTTTTTTAPPAPAKPAPAEKPAAPKPAAQGEPPDSDFDKLASCESGQRWNLSTGNGYYGGLQFDAGTWDANGGDTYSDLPHQTSRANQILVARKLWRARGWRPWPTCARQTGLAQ